MELRRQIGKLEAELAQAAIEGPTVAAAARMPRTRARGAHVLSLAELERLRDGLVGRLDAVREAARAEAARHARARILLEAMLADPSGHRWGRVRNSDLGLPGCNSFHVRPRLGPLGLLMDWWRVKISSGCPLAGRREGASQPFSSGAIVRPAPESCSQ